MTRNKEDHGDLRSVVQKLSEAVARADKDDLAGLAKMHTWCEVLANPQGASGAPVPADVREAAKQAAGLLEAIILGEAEDPGSTLSSLGACVASIELLAQANAAPPEAAAVSSEGDNPSPEEIAEKLSHVFEDPEPEPVTKPKPKSQPKPLPKPKTEAPVAAEMQAPESSVPPQAAAESVKGGTPKQSSPATEPAYEQVPLVIEVKELEFVKGFVEEALEHIESIETAVLEVERAPEDSGNIDNLFRPFHTIKGMAGFLNLRDINCLTHEVETLLDQGRRGLRPITPGLIDLILDVVDILKAQIAAVGTFVQDPKEEPIPQPPISQMIEKLRAVVAGRLEPDARQPQGGGPGRKVGENLVEQGACAKEVVDFALAAQQSQPVKKTGELVIEMGAATPRQVNQALRAQKPEAAPAKTAGGDQSVRIDTAKLDGLVEMVGELVIAQTQVSANPIIATDPRLGKDAAQVTKIVRDVQEVAMAMRMIPIGSTFQKMARLVRDVSRKAGKNVELHISGEETELDKNVIQQINDPLVHMVRNAVDHGVEAPAARAAAGKPETGSVYLSAFHQGGNIVIEIRDDGKGLDPKRLIAKGKEKGLISPDEELTDQQAYHLIFAPGFSMAEKVTDISGRGVGMDVVRRNIEQLRGKVDIHSTLGQGTTFAIRLPLTLAIIDGMVIQVGVERFIIPTIAIEQALRPVRSQISTIQQKGEVLAVRGRLIPLIQLGDLFGLSDRCDPCGSMVVIAHCEGRQIGLVVSELIGQQQVVIKTLGERFQGLKGISGAAILGDGRVGLILEMSGVAAAYRESVGNHTLPGLGRTEKSVTPSFSGEEAGERADEPEMAEVQELELAGVGG